MPQETKPAVDKKTDPKMRQMTIAEFKALEEKEAKKFKVQIPLPVKLVLALPIIVVCLFGLFYIPFLAIKGCTSGETTKK